MQVKVWKKEKKAKQNKNGVLIKVNFFFKIFELTLRVQLDS